MGRRCCQVFFCSHVLEHLYPVPQQSAQQNLLPSIDVLQQGDNLGSLPPCAVSGERRGPATRSRAASSTPFTPSNIFQGFILLQVLGLVKSPSIRAGGQQFWHGDPCNGFDAKRVAGDADDGRLAEHQWGKTGWDPNRRGFFVSPDDRPGPALPEGIVPGIKPLKPDAALVVTQQPYD